jgi:hypothetical protein
MSGTLLAGTEEERLMADIVYLGVTAVFFWLTWLLVRLCERL